VEATTLLAEVLSKIQLAETFKKTKDLSCVCETATVFLPYYEEAQATETPTSDKPPKYRKRGRPRKDIDPLIVIHMISNRAKAADVAEFLGIHRDTIYASHREAFDEGRKLFREKWSVIGEEIFQNYLKERKLKEELRKKKQKDYRAMYYQKHSK
jgi:predicted nucleotidyltransferase